MDGPDRFPEFETAPTPEHRRMARDVQKIRGVAPSFLLFLRMNFSWLIFRHLPLLPFLWIIDKYSEEKASIALLLMLAAWGLYFDVKQIRHQASSWGLFERVIDWDKVAKIAGRGD